MKNFDAIFHAAFLGIYLYHIFYFMLQYRLLKRIDLLYYSLFLLSVTVYLFGFITPVIFNFSFGYHVRTVFSAVEMSFAFIQNYLYFSFAEAYIGITKNTKPVYKWFSFFKKFCVANFILFLIMGILKIESRDFYSIVGLMTLPFSIYILTLLWKLGTNYSKIIIVGTTFGLAATISAYCCIAYETYTKLKLPFQNTIPYQIGLLLDLFVLAYGLSLKTAATDKKLVASLQENQKLVETERNRVARDLHDGLGGMLSGIKLTLNSMTGTMLVPDNNTSIFHKAIAQVDNAIKEMRHVAHSMMPEALLKFGLSEAIQDFCDGINENDGVKMKFTKIGMDKTMEKSTELVVYRIVQELSNNAIKHAVAKNIFIQLNTHPKGITITVEDDGKGFDADLIDKNKSTGLQNVQSRIDYLKGSWDIQSAAGTGTSVNIEIPV